MSPIEKQNLIQSLNEISYNHEDLMSVVLDFSDSYIEDHKKRILPYFENPSFLQQSVLCVREALVLSVNGLILAENIPFEDIIEGCVNEEAQEYHLQNLNPNPTLKKEIITFWNSLRKEVFSTIYNQHKSSNKDIGLSDEIIKNRFDLFIRKFS